MAMVNLQRPPPKTNDLASRISTKSPAARNRDTTTTVRTNNAPPRSTSLPLSLRLRNSTKPTPRTNSSIAEFNRLIKRDREIAQSQQQQQGQETTAGTQGLRANSARLGGAKITKSDSTKKGLTSSIGKRAKNGTSRGLTDKSRPAGLPPKPPTGPRQLRDTSNGRSAQSDSTRDDTRSREADRASRSSSGRQDTRRRRSRSRDAPRPQSGSTSGKGRPPQSSRRRSPPSPPPFSASSAPIHEYGDVDMMEDVPPEPIVAPPPPPPQPVVPTEPERKKLRIRGIGTPTSVRVTHLDVETTAGDLREILRQLDLVILQMSLSPVYDESNARYSCAVILFKNREDALVCVQNLNGVEADDSGVPLVAEIVSTEPSAIDQMSSASQSPAPPAPPPAAAAVSSVVTAPLTRRPLEQQPEQLSSLNQLVRSRIHAADNSVKYIKGRGFL